MIRSYSSILFWLGLTIASSIMLYHTSDRVTGLDRELRQLNAEIEREREGLHVLKAEWVYLSNPARIETEAKHHLGMQATATARIATMDTVNHMVPMKDGIEPPVKVAKETPAKAAQPSAAAGTDEKPRTERDRVLAGLNAGRINDRMKLQPSKAAVASTDRIGALIGKLGMQP